MLIFHVSVNLEKSSSFSTAPKRGAAWDQFMIASGCCSSREMMTGMHCLGLRSTERAIDGMICEAGLVWWGKPHPTFWDRGI
jgi:hypothetical protein